MNYYETIITIRDLIRERGIVQTVTHGSLSDVDIKRQNLFPIAHITPLSTSYIGTTITYSFSLIFCDLVDFNKYNIKNENIPFYGTSNIQDILNQMDLEAQAFLAKATQGDIILFAPELPAGSTFFVDRFENQLAGVELAFSVTTPSDLVESGIC